MPEISEERLKELEEKAQQADAIAASKRRVEEENNKIKARAKEAEEKLSTAEKAKLEAEGKTQELLEAERKEKLELKQQLIDRRKSSLREKLRTDAMKLDPSIKDVDLVLKVSEHKSLLKLDEENETIEGLEDYLKAARESKPFLFAEGKIDAGDNKPPKSGNKDEDFKTEDDKYLSELRACSTRKEMNKVREKYGKQVE